MKKSCFLGALMCLCLMTGVQAQESVTIKGNVKFIDKDFKISVFRRVGTNKQILAETKVNDDHTYSLTVPVDQAGEALVNCGNWQTVNVWLEDENLDIDFRGMDTARIKIKNPPFVYIKGGKNNDLMNLINFEDYRAYQQMIAISQAAYRAKFADDESKKNLTMSLYDMNSENNNAHMKYLAEHFADRNSVLSVLKRLNYDKNETFINSVLDNLLKVSPNSATMVENYRKVQAEQKERRERMKVGNPAPMFTFKTTKGKNSDISKYKGKVVVLDFWASWCGPCRQEIPNMKKYYEEFKGKDVEFLSVSIDAKKKDWEKAMGEENMAWQQGWVEDGGKQVMDLYQFNGIPFILVLDKDGKIYAKNLRGEAIRQAVEKALNGEKAAQPKSISVGMMGASM